MTLPIYTGEIPYLTTKQMIEVLAPGDIIIEKPFGHDLASARELDRVVHATFDES